MQKDGYFADIYPLIGQYICINWPLQKDTASASLVRQGKQRKWTHIVSKLITQGHLWVLVLEVADCISSPLHHLGKQ